MFIHAFLSLYLVFLLQLCYTANRGMCRISQPQTVCLCDSPFDRSRRRDINRRPTEYRLMGRKRKRAKKPTAHGHNRVAVSSKWGKGKRHRTQRPRSTGAKEAGQHRLLGAAICQNDRGGKAGGGENPLRNQMPREG